MGDRDLTISLFLVSLALTYSPGILVLPLNASGYFAALSLLLILMLVSLYICISRLPLDLAILMTPPMLLGIIVIYSVAYKIVVRDLILGTALLIVIALAAYALLLISRLALRRRHVAPPPIEDPWLILRSIFRDLRGRLDAIMISLGFSLIVISIIDMILIIVGLARSPVYLYNPLVIAGTVASSIMISKISFNKILMPAASWASVVLLYSDMRSRVTVRLPMRSRRTIKIRGLMSREGYVELPLDTRSSPHIIISGNTGSGKTSLCKILARAYREEGVGVIIIDYHGEYNDLDGYLILNASDVSPQIIPHPPEEARVLELVDSIRRIFRLGALQVSMLTTLTQEMVRRGGRSFRDLLGLAEEILSKTEDPQSRDILASLIPYLRILATHIRGEPIDLDSMLSSGARHVVFNMSTVGSDYASTIYAEYVLKQIWRHKVRKGQREEVDLVIIIDEAHNILRGSSEEFVSRIFRESRKYGLSLVISTQQFEKLSQELINNTDNFFFLRHTDPRVVDKISLLIEGRGGGRDAANAIRSLKPLEGLLYNASSGALIRVSIGTDAEQQS